MRLGSSYLAMMLLALPSALTSAGCAEPVGPPQVTVAQIEPYRHPAKGPDCKMPVLRAEPNVGYRKVAIVEGWGDVGQEDQVLSAVERRACETGADALLVVATQTQNQRYMLYGVHSSQETGQASPQGLVPGATLSKHEKIPAIGESGHRGYYVEAYAIDFKHG